MAVSKATQEWRQIARGSDPLYDIASVPGMRGRWTPEEFYAHGRDDWSAFRGHWDHYDPERGGTCLEIGCGAGRLTAALAPDFDRVIAVDVSADMLERARAVAPANVDLRQTDGHTLPAEDAGVDAVFSVHVVQHLESRADVERYIAEIRRVLRPGGTLLVHVKLKDHREGIRERIRREVELQRSRLALRLGREHLTMRVRTYWIADVYRMLVQAGFESIELRMIITGAYGHQCWFATAPRAEG